MERPREGGMQETRVLPQQDSYTFDALKFGPNTTKAHRIRVREDERR